MMCEYNAQQKIGGGGGGRGACPKIGGVAWAHGLLRHTPLTWIRHCNVVTSTEKLQIMIVYL